MLRVGIIGYGKMGILHGALVNGSKRAKVVAVCDKSWVMRFGIKRVYPSVKTFKDVKEMLNTVELDAVIISTPTFNHVESALLCIEKNCHLFIEKPLASSYEDAKRLYDAATEKNVMIQVGFCNRFAPSIAKGKEMLDAGIIGKPESAKAYMYIADVFEAHSGWRYSKAISGGGVLMDFGIHMLDQMCWYFGEIDNIEAKERKLYSKEVEDELQAKIEFKSGTKVKFETSWSKEEYRKSYANLEIVGTKGKMIVTDQTLDIYDLEGNRIENLVYPDLYDGAFMDVGGLLYSKQMQYFLDALDGKHESNLKSAVYDQKAIKYIYESAEKKQKIVMK